MKSLWRFLLANGFAIMMAGFVLAAASLFFFMKYRYRGGILRSALLAAVIAGFSLYVIGRILVFAQKRLGPRSSSNGDEQ